MKLLKVLLIYMYLFSSQSLCRNWLWKRIFGSNICSNKWLIFMTKLIVTQRPFTNYVDKIMASFDHLPPCVDILVDKKWTFLDHLPTSSCKRSLWTNCLKFGPHCCWITPNEGKLLSSSTCLLKPVFVQNEHFLFLTLFRKFMLETFVY